MPESDWHNWPSGKRRQWCLYIRAGRKSRWAHGTLLNLLLNLLLTHRPHRQRNPIMFHWTQTIWGQILNFILMNLCLCSGLCSGKFPSKAIQGVRYNQHLLVCPLKPQPSSCSFFSILARFYSVGCYNQVRVITSSSTSWFIFCVLISSHSFSSYLLHQNNSTIVAKTRNSMTIQIDFEDEEISSQLDVFAFRPQVTMQNEFGDYVDEVNKAEARHLGVGHRFVVENLLKPGRNYAVRSSLALLSLINLANKLCQHCNPVPHTRSLSCPMWINKEWNQIMTWQKLRQVEIWRAWGFTWECFCQIILTNQPHLPIGAKYCSDLSEGIHFVHLRLRCVWWVQRKPVHSWHQRNALECASHTTERCY